MSNYKSVEDMLNNVFDTPEAAKEVKQKANETRLLDSLIKSRIRAGKSQADIAQITGWNASKVSRFENKTDKEIRLDELAQYCSALGLGVGINIATPIHSRAEAIHTSIRAIERHLDELTEIAKESDDNQIIQGIYQFKSETLLKLMTKACEHIGDMIDNINLNKPEGDDQVNTKDECLQLTD